MLKVKKKKKHQEDRHGLTDLQQTENRDTHLSNIIPLASPISDIFYNNHY